MPCSDHVLRLRTVKQLNAAWGKGCDESFTSVMKVKMHIKTTDLLSLSHDVLVFSLGNTAQWFPIYLLNSVEQPHPVCSCFRSSCIKLPRQTFHRFKHTIQGICTSGSFILCDMTFIITGDKEEFQRRRSVFCTMSLILAIFMIIYDVLQHY